MSDETGVQDAETEDAAPEPEPVAEKHGVPVVSSTESA